MPALLASATLLVASPAFVRTAFGASSGSQGVASQDPAVEAPGSQEVTTREELWRQLRMQKSQGELEPRRPNFFERQLLIMEDPESRRLLDANFGGFYPRAQFISRGSNLGFGTRFWRPDLLDGRLDIHGSAFYSLDKYQFYDFQIGRIPHRGELLPLRSWKGDDVYELGDPNLRGASRITLYASLRYRHLPKEDYYGLGPDARRTDRASYLQEDALVELVAGYQLAPWMVVSFRGGVTDYAIGPGEDENVVSIERRFDDASAPGLTDARDFSHLSAQALIDLRDEPGNPHRGLMVAAELTRFDDLGGQEFRFDRFAFDARGFLRLGADQRVVALRTLLFFDNPEDGNEVPFYLMESLGGSHTLRGYDSFRFRDEKVVLFQAEYRWEAAPPFELVLFSDAGTVAESLADLELSEMKTDYGVGLRIKNYRATVFRLDYALGDETNRLYFRFSSSF